MILQWNTQLGHNNGTFLLRSTSSRANRVHPLEPEQENERQAADGVLRQRQEPWKIPTYHPRQSSLPRHIRFETDGAVSTAKYACATIMK